MSRLFPPISLSLHRGKIASALRPRLTTPAKFVAITFVLVAALGLPAFAQDRTSDRSPDWKASLVTLDIKRKRYDYFQPWTRPLENAQKLGVVAGSKEILTTAEGLADNTLLRAQKNGRGSWFVGSVKWIDYHANLAMVTVGDEHFWDDLKPVSFGKPASVGTPMSLLRWKAGKIEQFRAEFKQYAVEDSRLSYASYAQLELTSEIDAAGGAEPVVSGGKVLGLVSAREGNNCRAIPAAFLRRITEAHTKEMYPGLGFFDFVWEPGQNPATLKLLRDPDLNKGVVIIDAPERAGSEGLKARDVLLQVDGSDIDSTGDYNDPDYGFLSLENLATRAKWAGDRIPLTVLREGKKITVDFKIPKVDYPAKLVPDELFDQPPQYMIVGGLVFEPLSNSYLRSWGSDWRHRAPFRLNYYNNESPTKERPSLVLLSQVLPDPFNLGYQDDRFLVVDKVNGVKIAKLKDLQAALEKPVDGFHVIEFMSGERVLKAVLDAATEKEATRRILENYRIEDDHVFAP
jgi:hypothetical protein